MIKMKQEKMSVEIKLPDSVEAKLDGNIIQLKGTKGSLARPFYYHNLSIELKPKSIVLSCKNATKRDKTNLGTFEAILKNMIKGVSEGFVYKLKICSSHFPMNVSFKDNILSVKNFLGEKVPRTLEIPNDVSLKVDGNIIVLEGIDKEKVGAVAGSIEKLTRITNRDRRRFQDGIYIIEKAGKAIV